MTTTSLPPLHEPYPPDLARKYGAVKGMKCKLKTVPKSWEYSQYKLGQTIDERDLAANDYICLTGTIAALTTPLPESKCDCGANKKAPVQGFKDGIPWALHLKAYEVYCQKYGAQEAMIDLEGRGCRGGFHAEELDKFIPNWREQLTVIHAPSCASRRQWLRILPHELAALDAKPEGLVWAVSRYWLKQHRSEEAHLEWELMTQDDFAHVKSRGREDTGDFAYAVPAPLEEKGKRTRLYYICQRCQFQKWVESEQHGPQLCCRTNCGGTTGPLSHPVQWDKNVSMADARAAQAEPPPIATGKDFFNEWCGKSYVWEALTDIERGRWNKFAKAILKRYAK